jgi:serine/threonine protein kinase
VLRALTRFTREDIESEAGAIIQLYSDGTSENLIQVFSQGWVDERSGCFRIDMELCACNLEQYILKEVQIPFEMRESSCPGDFSIIAALEGPWREWDILEQISKAIEFIHSCNLVHRDLKPRNGEMPNTTKTHSLVLYSPSQRLWKVADFGMTSDGTSRREVTTKYGRGTTGYRAPELVRTSQYNNKVDIFAIGYIFFELFTNGENAFTVAIKTVGANTILTETQKSQLKVRFLTVLTRTSPPPRFRGSVIDGSF